MPRPSASPALRVLRTLRTGSRMTLRRHKDFLALAALCRKSPATADYSPSGHSALPWLAAQERYDHGDAAYADVIENKNFILQRRSALMNVQLLFEQAAKRLALYYRDHSGLGKLPDSHELPQDLEALVAKKLIKPLVIAEQQTHLVKAHPQLKVYKAQM